MKSPRKFRGIVVVSLVTIVNGLAVVLGTQTYR